MFLPHSGVTNPFSLPCLLPSFLPLITFLSSLTSLVCSPHPLFPLVLTSLFSATHLSLRVLSLTLLLSRSSPSLPPSLLLVSVAPHQRASCQYSCCGICLVVHSQGLRRYTWVSEILPYHTCLHIISSSVHITKEGRRRKIFPSQI